MKRKAKRYFSVAVAATLFAGSVVNTTTLPVMAQEIGASAQIELTQQDVEALTGGVSYARTSVHDPSIIPDGNGNYYIFGSHMGVSKTGDLQNWVSVTGESLSSTLFGNANGEVVSYAEAFTENAYTGAVTVLDSEGNPYEVDLGSYDAAAWIGDNTVAGNMWAPDIIYNEAMGKWCMYMSLNGATWNSSIVLMTSDNIEGPYVYQGPVVFSGFSTSDSSKSFKNTDLELVIGEQEELPAKYQKIADSSWGTYWPHAIDPAVFYDETGNLWLVYGSWSGGIYVLELDENTGLRDYTVTYEDTFDALGASVTSDPYFGKKIAGGYYVSGEGAYVEHIGNYYYLFVSYGFYSPDGGYNMRVFRSETPDGPYVDASGNSAIFNKYIMNYSSTSTTNNYGVKLMGNYKWDTMDEAEVAQGHNSAFVDADGKAYVVYHTKFADGTVGHEVRVHQLFMSEDGWLVAAPYEYAGETLSATGYSVDAVAGQYGVIAHDYQVDYADLEYITPENIVLHEDGTITGAYEGTWSMQAGSPYATLVLNGTEYQGVFTEQVITGSNIKTMCFTVVSDAGLCIWGSGEPTDDAIVAQNAVNAVVSIPENTYANLDLATEGLNGAVISWSSDKPEVLSAEGVVTRPAEDTVVTLTETISKGNYFFERKHIVTVKAAAQNSEEALVVASYFTNEAVDLSQHLAGTLSVSNPFYAKTNYGIDVSNGVTIEFDAVATGDVHMLGTIFSFMADAGANGRMYFTPGSYFGYNADGGYFDANMKNFGLVEDYIGESAHVAINITDAGFAVSVNGEVVYTEEILTTENGAGSVTDYSKVLDWLRNSADTLYFGHGSWWNAAGFDEANILLSNVVCSVAPVDAPAADDETADSVYYTKDEVVLATNADLTIEANPFYGKNVERIYMEYTINMAEGAAQNGWDGIFSFYNSATTGRISIQTAPYLCFNNAAGGWMDVNQPGAAGATNEAPAMAAGTEYQVTISVDAKGIVMTVNGEELAISVNGAGADYEDIVEYIATCDQLTWGVGQAQSSYWFTELCTLTDIKLASSENAEAGDEEVVVNTNPQILADTVVLGTNADINTIANPFMNAEFDAVTISYTINFSEAAIKTGWDGLFSFYNSVTGGRVSIQSAPYICYNDMAGKWMDINQPGTTLADYGIVAGVDYDFDIVITEDAVKMYINGVQIAITEVGSGATYADMIAFIGTCDQFTWGVGQATTAFWWTELCTLTDVSITSKVPTTLVYENAGYTMDAVNYCEVIANPYYGQELERLYLEYTINFAATAAKNGWDGIFSFYNSTTGGRVSVQSAPYICYNDMVGNWMDINQPGAGGDNAAAFAATGEDVRITIDITKDAIVMTANGAVLAVAEAGSGATYADLLAFISECDQLTLGVGEGATAFWWSELATIRDLTMAPVVVNAQAADASMGTVSVTGTGAAATLTAVPAAYHEFLGWYAGNVLISTENTVAVSVCENVTLTAQFKKIPYAVSYEVTSAYGDYLQGAVTIRNISGETLNNWSASFDYIGGTITALWGATFVSQNGTAVVVSAPSWDKELADGEEITIGFTVKLDEADVAPVFANAAVIGKKAAPIAESTYKVALNDVSSWPCGYSKNIVIENVGVEAIESWTLEFDFADEIASIWNAEIISHEGNHYVISNCGYNADIAVNVPMTIGFIGTPANGAEESTAELSNVVLKGLK